MNEMQKRMANAPVADDGIFVGPDWIRVGKHADQPMADRLSAEQIVNRAAEREIRRSGGWVLFWTAIGLLAVAAALFTLIYEGLR